MKAVVVEAPGGPEVMHIAEVPDPRPGEGEVLLRVAATAVNRADLLQRMGLYPPPPGASEIIGMEASGTVAVVSPGVEGWSVGDPACALLSGGGYAELVAVPAGQLLRVPNGVDLVSAGAIPEVFLTAHDNLVTRGGLRSGETVLIHGGAGGVGTAAIQIAHRLGARVLTTAGSRSRLERCLALGADAGINHRDEDFVARTLELTDGRGADLILDVMGASYLERNLNAVAADGRIVVIGMQGGLRAEIDLNSLMRRRATLTGSTLRGRSVEQKAAVVALAQREIMPGFEDGGLRPIVDRILPLAEVADAHRAMEAGEQFGKIVLSVGP
jgi:putative PIG3 family NAD(P)H quinone oxidoreductase